MIDDQGNIVYRGYTFVLGSSLQLHVWHGGDYVDAVPYRGQEEDRIAQALLEAKKLVDEWMNAA